MFGKLVIFGVGLIGGSVALALRKAGAVRHIVGVDRNNEMLEDALRLGVIDTAAHGADCVTDADIVLLAAPVAQMGPLMTAIAPYLSPGTIVTDAGSAKTAIIDAARANLGEYLPRFVPGHPIAGTEKNGVTAASAHLYQGCTTVLTPLAETDETALEAVRTLWQLCGARVSTMPAETHDRIFAAVSHLPHLLAFALVDEIALRPNAEQLFGFAASGFRDFTRIAGSSPEMWRDICLANRSALLAELDAYLAQLSRLREIVAAGDGAALEMLFKNASEARNTWIRNFEKQ
jgi:prephenate dehydrogenase